MDEPVSNFAKTTSDGLDARALLEKSPEQLLGVSAAAASELEKLGIQTVFDLAASSVFAMARRIAAPVGEEAWTGSERLPGDFIDSEWRTTDREALALRPIESLRAIGPALGQSLSAALAVNNVRELALWPPYHAARQILSQAYGLGAAAPDPEAPPELVPGARPYPTERVQYEILVLDELDGAAPDAPAPDVRTMNTRTMNTRAMASRGGDTRGGGRKGGEVLGPVVEPAGIALETAGQLDLSMATAAVAGFTRPAFGAVLTYTQTWFPEGLALGQLLHTLALAPGESTRLAMVDWSRRASTTASEDISERDALSANIERGRSIGEIVNAVATEAQQGFSESFGIGAGTSAGTATGGAGSADLSSMTGLPLKVAGGSGESTGVGLGVGYARSSAWTTGQRNLSANMAQNILDRTHQASTIARNRRATIVREVSQAESERVSTRTVTNYNHMHALSIEYFEVVQLYRVMVDLTRVSAALFVPMKLIDFNAPGVIQRHRRVIIANGLTPQVRALGLAEPDNLLISAPDKIGNWQAVDTAWVAAMLGEPVGDPGQYALALPFNFFPMFIWFEEDAPFDSIVFEMANGAIVTFPVLSTINNFAHAIALGEIYGNTVEKAAPFWDVVSIRARRASGAANWSGNVTFFLRMAPLRREGFPAPNPGTIDSLLRVTIPVTATASEVTIFEMAKTVSGRALRQHLMDNQLYYSQRIWQSVDSTTVAQLLSGYTFGGRPVLSDVDPLPLTVAGNFLVFRKHEPADAAGQAQWAQWLAAKDIKQGERQTDLVPLPSGGVFAEAVLGRFNSAEKLDITRFWNWQDSPIPITPPEIAAIQTGSRARDEGLVPGQLQPTTLNIQIPPDLPDPEGLEAILQAIQNGNMFRDMSGLNSTIGFAQSAMTRAFDAARDAASQAGENMKTAADIYKSAFGGGAGAGASGAGGPSHAPAEKSRNPSETGALINHAQDMDRRGVPPPDAVSDPSEWAAWPGESEPPLSPPPLVQAPTNEGRVVHGPPKATPPQTPAAPIETQIAIQAVVNRDGTDTKEPLSVLLQMDFWRSAFNQSGEAAIASDELVFSASRRLISNNNVVATRTIRPDDTLMLRPRVFVDPTMIAFSADRVVKALFGTVAGWPTLEALRNNIYLFVGSNVEVEVPNPFATPIFPSGNRLKLKLSFNLRTDSGVEASFNLANQLGLKYDQNGTLKFDTGDIGKLAGTLAGMASKTPVGAGLSALLSLLSFQGSVSNTLALDAQGTGTASLKIKPTTLESVSIEQVT